VEIIAARFDTIQSDSYVGSTRSKIDRGNVRYHRFVTGIRVVAFLMAFFVAAGPALLDRCLISCHDEPSSGSAVPPCHESVPETRTVSIHGLSACGHDHEALPADTIADGRVFAARHLSVAGSATPTFVLDLPLRPLPAAVPLLIVPSSSFVPALVQLRL
jgi:hypothetical protein